MNKEARKVSANEGGIESSIKGMLEHFPDYQKHVPLHRRLFVYACERLDLKEYAEKLRRRYVYNTPFLRKVVEEEIKETKQFADYVVASGQDQRAGEIMEARGKLERDLMEDDNVLLSHISYLKSLSDQYQEVRADPERLKDRIVLVERIGMALKRVNQFYKEFIWRHKVGLELMDIRHKVDRLEPRIDEMRELARGITSLRLSYLRDLLKEVDALEEHYPGQQKEQ